MWWAWKGEARRYVHNSLWIVPALFGVVGAFLGVVVVSIDDSVDITFAQYDIGTSTALLTSFIAAMVSFTGFFLTTVTFIVQFATSQLTTRILMLTYRDWRLKAVLGLFICTMVYAFVLLGRLRGDTIPNFSVVFAGVLMLVSILTFLWYLSYFASTIRPATMASLVAEVGRQVILESLPASLESPTTRAESFDPSTPYAFTRTLTNGRHGGFILALNEQGMIDAARRSDGVMLLHYVVGDYVSADAKLLTFYGNQSLPNHVSVRNLIQFGPERTFTQDPAYALRILADIALKALSDAINDPTTAVVVIDRIGELLVLVGQRDLGYGSLRDKDEITRMVVPVRSWSDYLHLTLDEIRAYGVDDVQVARRLRALLDELTEVLPDARHAELHNQLMLLERAVLRQYPDEAERAIALRSDRQGLGHTRSSGVR